MNAKTILLQEGAVETLTEALRPAAKATAVTTEPASAPADSDLPVPMDEAPTTPNPEAPDAPTTADDTDAPEGDATA